MAGPTFLIAWVSVCHLSRLVLTYEEIHKNIRRCAAPLLLALTRRIPQATDFTAWRVCDGDVALGGLLQCSQRRLSPRSTSPARLPTHLDAKPIVLV